MPPIRNKHPPASSSFCAQSHRFVTTSARQPLVLRLSLHKNSGSTPVAAPGIQVLFGDFSHQAWQGRRTPAFPALDPFPSSPPPASGRSCPRLRPEYTVMLTGFSPSSFCLILSRFSPAEEGRAGFSRKYRRSVCYAEEKSFSYKTALTIAERLQRRRRHSMRLIRPRPPTGVFAPERHAALTQNTTVTGIFETTRISGPASWMRCRYLPGCHQDAACGIVVCAH